MASNRTGIISVTNSGYLSLDCFALPYLSAIFSGIGTVLHEHDYKMLFQPHKDKDQKPIRVELMPGCQADGIIFILFAVNLEALTRYFLPHLKKCGVPFVIIHSFDCPVGAPSIGLDSFNGGFIATEHLIKHGYDSVGCTVNPGGHNSVNALEGYRKALHQYTMPWEEKFVFQCKTWKITESYEYADKLLKDGTELPRALIVNQETQALGMVRRFREEGIRVPEDLAVVSFKDAGLEEYHESDLTVVSQPCVEKGAMAARMLMHIIQGKLEDSPTEILKLSLKIGKTCGCGPVNNK